MNKEWKRIPHIEWKEHRNEDLFLCHKCNNHLPWFYFCIGKNICINDMNDNTYKYMNDEYDRGCRQWACDNCIKNILYNEKLIIIYDSDGKIINMKDVYKH